MRPVNIHAAKTHLSRLIEAAEAGEDVIIAKAGRPVVRLTPIAKNPVRTGFASLKGKLRLADDFDAPLPARLLRAFGAKR